MASAPTPPTSASVNPIILIGSSLALVAGLAWNDVVQTAVQQYIPEGTKLRAKVIYAIIVTTIVTGIIYVIEYTSNKISGTK